MGTISRLPRMSWFPGLCNRSDRYRTPGLLPCRAGQGRIVGRRAPHRSHHTYRHLLKYTKYKGITLREIVFEVYEISGRPPRWKTCSQSEMNFLPLELSKWHGYSVNRTVSLVEMYDI